MWRAGPHSHGRPHRIGRACCCPHQGNATVENMATRATSSNRRSNDGARSKSKVDGNKSDKITVPIAKAEQSEESYCSAQKLCSSSSMSAPYPRLALSPTVAGFTEPSSDRGEGQGRKRTQLRTMSGKWIG